MKKKLIKTFSESVYTICERVHLGIPAVKFCLLDELYFYVALFQIFEFVPFFLVTLYLMSLLWTLSIFCHRMSNEMGEISQ